MSKRQPSPDLIPNPFIKKRNLAWTIGEPASQHRAGDGSYAVNNTQKREGGQHTDDVRPSAAAIESGEAQITDHLTHFTTLLSSYLLNSHPSISPATPRSLLSISDYSSLYSSNFDSPNGAHFVIHQHDHPVAGTHYDLRLQINGTSSASWAIMYGLPGDPNSKRLNRNATETRIHCLWNHLVETASASTGSLLIWDTGTYTILPRTSKHAPSHDPSSPSSSPESSSPSSPPNQQQLLHAAFQNRKIRLHLHGSKLPETYVLNLRLTKPEDAQGRLRSSRVPKFRRRKDRIRESAPETSSSSNSDRGESSDEDNKITAGAGEKKAGGSKETIEDPHITSATERELHELEDATVRATNAYPGAHNTINSVHQRRWYLSLDRAACGFVRRKGSRRWELGDNGSENEKGGRLKWPFYVRGAEEETSVVTGRKGADVLRDEGVVGFVPRKGWRPVVD